MMKRKHGDAVRSKNETAMRNEVLAKFVCHNLCCLIMAQHELGIIPALADEAAEEERMVLPMVRPC
jgi:hypothetical protein